MLRPQFIVLLQDGQWKVRHDGRHFGPFETAQAATVAAIEAAHNEGCHGYEPRVLVEDSNTKRLYVQWTFGDPYPPPAFAPFAHTGTPQSYSNR